MSGTHAKRGKPIPLLFAGRHAVRRAGSRVGKGGGKKRMLSCNGVDREKLWRASCPTRKRADFPLVFQRESV